MPDSNFNTQGVEIYDLFEPIRGTTPGADSNYKANTVDIKNNLMARAVSNNGPKTVNSDYNISGISKLQDFFEELGFGNGSTIRLSQNVTGATIINKTDIAIINANTSDTYYPNRMFIFLRGKTGSGGTGGIGVNGDGSSSVDGGGGGGGGGAGGSIWVYMDTTDLNQITFDGTDTFTFSIDGEIVGNYPKVQVSAGGNGSNGGTPTGGAGGAGGLAGTITNDPLGLLTLISSSAGKAGGAGGDHTLAGVVSNYTIGEIGSSVEFDGTINLPTSATSTPVGSAGATQQWSDVYFTYFAYGGGGGGGTPYANTAATNGTDGNNVTYDGGNGGNGAGVSDAYILICY